MKPSFSIVTLAYGRVRHLENMLACCLVQEYDGDWQVVIYNSCTKQVLQFDHPRVKIINAPVRLPSLGACRNAAIEACDFEHIVTADSDDALLPNHLSTFAKGFADGSQWVKHAWQFYAEGNAIKHISAGTLNVVGFTREAWLKAGRYSNMGTGEDRDFVGRLTATCPGKILNFQERETSGIYCWGTGVWHISGLGPDTPRYNSYARAEADLMKRLRNKTEPSGTIVLNPKMRCNWPALTRAYLDKHGWLREKINGVGVIQCGRFGDIINTLPIVKKLHDDGENPHLIVSREFASILDGVSYVTPCVQDYPWLEIDRATRVAQNQFTKVLRLQLYGKGHTQERQTAAFNMEQWREAGLLDDFHNPEMRPIFDRRDAKREALIVAKLFRTNRPKIVTNLTNAASSPFRNGPMLLSAIRNAFKDTHEVVEIGNLKLHRIYDLLAVIEKAALFISVDTATLHLAAATDTPVLALVNDAPWLGSVVRFNAAETFHYSEAKPNKVLDFMHGFLGTHSNNLKGKAIKRGGINRRIVVRRSNSIGDVLAATCVPVALSKMGFDVEFQASKHLHGLLNMVPGLKRVTAPIGEPTVNLDGAYENHPQRKSLHFAEMFYERANHDLEPYGVKLPTLKNFGPRLTINPKSTIAASKFAQPHPRPWIMICPRSNSFLHRTIHDEAWKQAAAQMHGTSFWLGNHSRAPDGIIDLNCRSIEQLAAFLACADIAVSVDSGPMHIAAALGVPLVAIMQSSSPDLHLSNQRDYVVISAGLDCLNCNADPCPINATSPPCQDVSPELIAGTVNRKLRSVTSNDVSAVIAVYKPNVEKLNRCLSCVLPQVSEVVICGDLDTPWPIAGLLQDEKIRCVRMPKRETGYGRKATFGARHSSGAFLFQLNDDVYTGENVVSTLMGEMKPNVAAVTHTLKHLDGRIQYAGKYRGRGSCGFGHLDHLAMKSRYSHPIEQESGCGASMLVRRSAFFQADGFDERFLLYCEDDSLVMQMRQNGWKSIFTPLCESLHEEHISVTITPRWREILNESNAMFRDKWKFYFNKNPNPNVIGRF